MFVRNFRPLRLWMIASRRKLYSKVLTCRDGYVQLLDKHPLVTKSVTAGIVAGSGDIICQIAFMENSFDLERLCRYSVVGLFLIGPTLHYWFRTLGRLIPGSSITSVVYRVAVDQLMFAPAFISVILSFVLVLEGRPEKIPEKLRRDWLNIVVTNYAVWVPTQFINFSRVPPRFQVLFSNAIGLFWNIYLSKVSNTVTPLPPLSPGVEVSKISNDISKTTIQSSNN